MTVPSDCMESVRLPLHEPTPLFDREDEIAVMHKAVPSPRGLACNCPDDGYDQALLITGGPGVGKTSLVQLTVKEATGVFCEGKYDQFKVHPLQGFVGSLTSLCRVLLVQEFKLPMSELSQSEATALFEAIPAMKEVVLSPMENDAKAAPYTDVGYRWGLESLKRSITIFLNSAYEMLQNKIILYLDDLQWADMASVELFIHLARETPRSQVCLIASCRSTHPHVIDKLLGTGDVKEVKLKDLRLIAVAKLLTYLTKREKGLEKLAKCIHSRTHGNPFHTLQFLYMLQDSKCLYYSIKTYQWEYEIDRIRIDTDITDNVVDLVQNNLRRLPPEVRQILFVSSFLGSHVDTEVVRSIIEMQPHVIQENLKMAVLAGLINFDMNRKRFKFVHDRIQQAAYELNPTNDATERELIHLRIGNFLLEKASCPDTGEDWMLPVAVTNLNHAPSFCRTNSDKLALADANFDAAKAMISKAAFLVAVDYLRHALELLESMSNKWINNYGRSLEVITLLTQMQLCAGDFDSCHALADEVIQYARCLDDKLEVFAVRAEALCAEERSVDDLKPGYDMLLALGESCPRKPSKARVGVMYLRVSQRLRKMSDADILALRPATRRTEDVVQKIGQMMGVKAWIANDKNTVAAVGLFAIQCLLRYGHSKYSSAVIASYASMCSVVGDIAGARRMGKLATKLIDMYPDAKCRVQAQFSTACFCDHLDQPIHQCLDSFIDMYDLGMRVGETHYACLSALCYVSAYVYIGLPLAPIVADMKRFDEHFKEYGQTLQSQVLACYHQYALNMMGQASHLAVLDGDALSSVELLSSASEKNVLAVQAYYDFSAWLAIHFGSLPEANCFADRLCGFHDVDGAIYYASWVRLSVGIAYVRMARHTGQHRRYIRKVKSRCLRYFKFWLKHDILNVQHKWLLLKSELLSLDRRVDVSIVREKYRDAIQLASRTGFVADAALGNELCGEFLMRNAGDQSLACDYFAEACILFEQMGARAKVNQIRERHHALRGRSGLEPHSSGAFRGRMRFSLEATQQHSRKFPFPDFLSSMRLSNSSLQNSKSSNELNGSLSQMTV